MEKTAGFYEKHFGCVAHADPDGRIIELAGPGGISLMIHKAAVSQTSGQSTVKLVFDVPDVEGFIASARDKGLKFGAVHKADGYVFANCKDPSGNPVSISSRAYRKQS